MKHSETEDLDLDDHGQYIYRNPTSNARNQILAAHYEIVPLTIKGSMGHREHLLNIDDFNGKNLAFVDADASLHFPALTTSSVSTAECETEKLKAWSADLHEMYGESLKVDKINGRNVEYEHKKQQEHNGDKGIHFTESSIDHSKIQHSGSRSHDEIDAHLGDSSIHFKQEQIQHKAIQGCGNNSHEVIDSHLGNRDVHLTVQELDHAKLDNLKQDAHPQYLLCNGHRPVVGLVVEKKLKANSIETQTLQSPTIDSDKLTAKTCRVDEVSVAGDLKVEGDSDLGRLRTKDIEACGKVSTGQLDVHGDICISGKVDGIKLPEFYEEYLGHNHRIFNCWSRGLVPPPRSVSENIVLTSCGKWKPLRVYVELYNREVLCNPETKWEVVEDTVTIPYDGVYEISLHNFRSVLLNGEELDKSKNLGSHKFLLKLQKGDTIKGQETSEIGSLYITLLSYGKD